MCIRDSSNASNRSSTSLPRPRWSAWRPAHQRITLSSRSCPWSIDVERRALRVAPEDHRGQGDAQSATARRPAARRAYDSRRPHIAARDLRVRQKRAQNALPLCPAVRKELKIWRCLAPLGGGRCRGHQKHQTHHQKRSCTRVRLTHCHAPRKCEPRRASSWSVKAE